MNSAKHAATHFGFGTDCELKPLGNGLINSTFIVDGGYVLQKINTNVFRDPDVLMNNIGRVTGFLRNKIIENGGDPDRETLNFLKADTGKLYYTDEKDNTYRVYKFVDDSISLDAAENASDLYASGLGFGNFQKQLGEFNVSTLVETIPDFHNTPKRLEAFKTALVRNVAGRAEEVKAEIGFVLAHEQLINMIWKMYQKLPMRVTHNDTKLNNVLLDASTRKPLCIIDLDTVMPGYAATDFGDAVRYGASTASEDEKDLTMVMLDMERYTQFAKGFLDGCGTTLIQAELDSLPYGCMMITIEQTIRFLTDYLNGDTYFKIRYPEHNLDRTRTQIKLLTDMGKNFEKMQNIIKG